MEKINKQLIINYIGIGLLLFLTFLTLGGLFTIIIDKWLLFLKLDYKIIFWTKQISEVGLFILIALLFRNYIKKKDLSQKNDFKNILITLIIVYSVAVVLQFIIPMAIPENIMVEIYKEQVNYTNTIRFSRLYLFLPYLLIFVKYGIAIKLYISKLEE